MCSSNDSKRETSSGNSSRANSENSSYNSYKSRRKNCVNPRSAQRFIEIMLRKRILEKADKRPERRFFVENHDQQKGSQQIHSLAVREVFAHHRTRQQNPPKRSHVGRFFRASLARFLLSHDAFREERMRGESSLMYNNKHANLIDLASNSRIQLRLIQLLIRVRRTRLQLASSTQPIPNIGAILVRNASMHQHSQRISLAIHRRERLRPFLSRLPRPAKTQLRRAAKILQKLLPGERVLLPSLSVGSSMNPPSDPYWIHCFSRIA